MDIKYIVLGLLICVGTVLSADDTCSNLTDKCCTTDGCGQCKDDSDKVICVSLTSIGDVANKTCDKDLCTADENGTSSTAAPETTTLNSTATTPETTSAGQNGTGTTTAEQTTAPTTVSENGTTVTENINQTTVITPTTQNGTTEGETTTPEATTQPPPSTTTKKPCKGGQHFDAASFVGGIILCGGLVAIIWFSCRYYRSKTETKYQQF